MKYLKKSALVLMVWLTLSPAYAAMVATPEMTAEPKQTQETNMAAQRQRIKLQLIELGVDPAEATIRVDQMADPQISSLQDKIAELPAGAGVSTTNLLLIIIILVLLL